MNKKQSYILWLLQTEVVICKWFDAKFCQFKSPDAGVTLLYQHEIYMKKLTYLSRKPSVVIPKLPLCTISKPFLTSKIIILYASAKE